MEKKQHITAFYLEALLLIVVFIGMILVLTQVFGMGQLQSNQAKLLTGSVHIAENAAELFAGTDNAQDLLDSLNEKENAEWSDEGQTALQVRYNRQFNPDRDGDIILSMTWEPEKEATGTMVKSRISVSVSSDSNPIYEIETASFKEDSK